MNSKFVHPVLRYALVSYGIVLLINSGFFVSALEAPEPTPLPITPQKGLDPVPLPPANQTTEPELIPTPSIPEEEGTLPLEPRMDEKNAVVLSETLFVILIFVLSFVTMSVIVIRKKGLFRVKVP